MSSVSYDPRATLSSNQSPKIYLVADHFERGEYQDLSSTSRGSLLLGLLDETGIHDYVYDAVVPRTVDHRLARPENRKFYIDQLFQRIEAAKPNIVVTIGETVLQSLTGHDSIETWRGSTLPFSTGNYSCKITGIYSPEDIIARWKLRFITHVDLRRIKAESSSANSSEPAYFFRLRPSYEETLTTLNSLLRLARDMKVRLSGDLETRLGHIACFGIGWNFDSAICIPFMCVEGDENYWTEEEEFEILKLIRRLFYHRNVEWVFQNGLYDYQYFIRRWRMYPANLFMDTMISHHVLFPGDLPKGLDFLSSMYNEFYRYWKDEGKEWNPKLHDEDQYWKYNCRDCVNTLEASYAIERTLLHINLWDQHTFQHRRFWIALDKMLRGVRTDPKARKVIAKECDVIIAEEVDRIRYILDDSKFNPWSHVQMKDLFYEQFGVRKRYKTVKNKKKGTKKKTLTLDSKSLKQIHSEIPILQPLIDKISHVKTLRTTNSTFIKMPLDEDGRMRCSYNVAGTDTFRYTSAKNAFGTGGNLQNISTGEEDYRVPNTKKLFLPDEGYIIQDNDLSAADAQIVAWEANDEPLKAIFREGLRLHYENARDIFGRYPTSDKDPIYKLAKMGAHAANYGVHSATLAKNLGIIRKDAEAFLRRWFSIHPAIRSWHSRIESELSCTRRVTNIFGFQRYFLGRIETLLPEALAWIPQSTVALIIEQGAQDLYYDKSLSFVEDLLQTHDSETVQFPYTPDWRETSILIKKKFEVELPYDDPLIIPVGVDVGLKSYGELVEFGQATF